MDWDWKNIWSKLLAFGYAIGVGFLSFAGMMALTPLVPLAIVAFVFAAVVVVQVYQGNIKHAISRLIDDDFYLQELVNDWLEEYLDRHLANRDTVDANQHPELAKYHRQKLRMAELLNIHHPDDEQQAEIKALQEQMRVFERQCFEYFTTDPKPDNKAELECIFSQDAQETIEYHNSVRKWVITPLSVLLGVGAGVSLGFTTAASTAAAVTSVAGIFGVTIGATAAAATGIGVAAFAAIAYAFAIRYTVAKILGDTKVQSLKQRTIDRLLDERVPLWQRVLLGVLAVVAISLAVALTILTAGGWWVMAQQGAKLFENFGTVAAKAIAAASVLLAKITTICYAIGSFCFYALNSLGTLIKARFGLKNPFPELWESIKHKIEEDGWLAAFNLPRLLMLGISGTFKALVFIVHVVSEALVSVKEGGHSAIATTVIASAVDSLTDANALFSAPEKTGSDEDDDNHKPSFREQMDGPEPHEHGALDAFVQYTLAFIFFVSTLHLWAAAWDYLATNCFGADEQPHKDFVDCFADSWKAFHPGVFCEDDHHHHDGHGHHQQAPRHDQGGTPDHQPPSASAASAIDGHNVDSPPRDEHIGCGVKQHVGGAWQGGAGGRSRGGSPVDHLTAHDDTQHGHAAVAVLTGDSPAPLRSQFGL